MITDEDKAFLAYIKRNKHIGYGRMMQIISNEWACCDAVGAHVAVTCLAELSKRDRESRMALRDWEVTQGMEYSV